MNTYFENHKDEIKEELLNIIKKEVNTDCFDISLETICKWLNRSNIYKNYIKCETFRKNFYSKYLDSLDEDKEDYRGCDFTMKNINNINIPWFSIEGTTTLSFLLTDVKYRQLYKCITEIKSNYRSNLIKNHPDLNMVHKIMALRIELSNLKYKNKVMEQKVLENKAHETNIKDLNNDAFR